jgi:hypothetical protein
MADMQTCEVEPTSAATLKAGPEMMCDLRKLRNF